MARFEKVSRFADVDIEMPVRKTMYSAGYDFVVAEDIVVPPMESLMDEIADYLALEQHGDLD